MGEDCACCCSLSVGIVIFILGVAIIDWIKRMQRGKASLVGEHVVITGGSSGIGKELGIKSAERGAHVTILARDVQKLEEACKEIRSRVKSSSQNINFFKADVTNYEEIESVFRRCEVEVGPIDILINCAGYAFPSKLEDIPLHHIKGMMDINYLGTAYAVRSVLSSMKSRRKGRIVCVSSVGGLVGLYGYTAYSASKFAIRGFCEALQMEVKPYGISVTVSCPPDTDTPCFEEENKVKPEETKLISASSGVFPPAKVAEDILRDTLAGDFFTTTGMDGNLSTMLNAGMSPMSSVFGLLLQTMFSGIIRLVSLGYLYSFNRIVENCASKKEKRKKLE